LFTKQRLISVREVLWKTLGERIAGRAFVSERGVW